MTTPPDVVVATVVDLLPGAYLWEQTAAVKPPATDLVVFDGQVPPEPPTRYVVVYPDDGTRNFGSVAQESTGELFRWTVHCVAPDRLRAVWLARRVRDGLVDMQITVPGWAPGLVVHSGTSSPQPDERVLERPAVVVSDMYRLLTERVPAPAES